MTRSWRNKKIREQTVEPFMEHVPQGNVVLCTERNSACVHVFEKESEGEGLQDKPKIKEQVQEFLKNLFDLYVDTNTVYSVPCVWSSHPV